jgi:hypothetical protein
VPVGSQKITGLAPAGPITGAELFEAVQSGNNVKVALSAIISVPVYATEAPAGGTYTDVVLPSASDLIYDVDTTAGNIIINGIVAQRDGQRVTWSSIGANLLQFGYLAGSLGNQIRASGGNATLNENDSITFQFCQEINSGQGAWVVV